MFKLSIHPSLLILQYVRPETFNSLCVSGSTSEVLVYNCVQANSSGLKNRIVLEKSLKKVVMLKALI